MVRENNITVKKARQIVLNISKIANNILTLDNSIPDPTISTQKKIIWLS